MKKVTLLIVSALLMVFTYSCKDDEEPPSMYENCGSPVFSDTSNFVLYLPNGFTPNGDGLNENFKIVARPTNSRVLYVTEFFALDYKGHVVYTKDTFLNTKNDLTATWDLKDHNGNLVLGNIEIRFIVVREDLIEYPVSYRVCSYTCESMAKENKSPDLSILFFEDQIQWKRGFVLPTLEKGC